MHFGRVTAEYSEVGSEIENLQFSRWREYGPLLGSVAGATVEAALESPLALYTDERIGMFYAPFDHVETGARVAIVGVTPGPTQAFTAIRSAQAALARGLGTEAILAGVKHDASFQGMRQDLIAWLDYVGLADTVGLTSCRTLFDTPAGLLHTTSAVRYPTFRRTAAGWQNWNGYGIGPLDHRVLRAMVVRALGPELRAIDNAVIVPLGKANEAVSYLCGLGKLDRSRCVLGFPHPSPASPRRHEIFAARCEDLRVQVATLSRGLGRATGTSRLRQTQQSSAPSTRSSVIHSDVHATSPSNGTELVIELTGGNIRNAHFYLRRHLSFFPVDAVGPANSKTGTGTPLTIHFAGLASPVVTDIAGGNKLMLRCRRDIAAFFRIHDLSAGDKITIARLAEREYAVQPTDPPTPHRAAAA